MASRTVSVPDPAKLASQLADVRRRLTAARALLLTTTDAIAPEEDSHGDALSYIAALIEDAADDVGGVSSLLAPEAA